MTIPHRRHCRRETRRRGGRLCLCAQAAACLAGLLTVIARGHAQAAPVSAPASPSPGSFDARIAPPPALSPYRPLRFDEDWSFLSRPHARRDLWDPVKFVPLDGRGTAYLSFGADARERYEYYRNIGFGRGPQDRNGYSLQRYLLHADAHFGSGFRVFTQLDGSLEDGRTGGPRPTDRDTPDLAQAFADGRVALAPGSALTLRAGRQEMLFGSSRLVSTGEGLNVRNHFDGLRLLAQSPQGRLDAFVTRPAKTREGAFDDGSDVSRLFWGLYAASPSALGRGLGAEAYFLDLDSRQEVYQRGTGREVRRTAGTRLFGQSGGWDYNAEGAYQWGRFAASGIDAWTLASDTGYTARGWALSPRLGLRADTASGDRGGRTLGTFNPLFPAINYFNLAGLAGVRNFVDVHPTLDLHPYHSVTVTGDWTFYWRESLRDGLYGPGGGLLTAGNGRRAKYIGSQPDLQAVWNLDTHASVLVDYSHFYLGGFLQQSGLGRGVDYFTAWASYKF